MMKEPFQCPSCNTMVYDDPDPVWRCMWCRKFVCVICYTAHGVKEHAKMYHLMVAHGPPQRAAPGPDGVPTETGAVRTPV